LARIVSTWWTYIAEDLQPKTVNFNLRRERGLTRDYVLKLAPAKLELFFRSVLVPRATDLAIEAREGMDSLTYSSDVQELALRVARSEAVDLGVGSQFDAWYRVRREHT